MTTPTIGTETLIAPPLNPVEIKVTKYGTSEFRISVGYTKSDQVPHYLVINNETGVVECANENLGFVREWVAHFTQRLQELDNGKLDPNEDEVIPEVAANFN